MSIEYPAKAMSVSPRSVKRAKKRMRDDPEAHDADKAGKTIIMVPVMSYIILVLSCAEPASCCERLSRRRVATVRAPNTKRTAPTI